MSDKKQVALVTALATLALATTLSLAMSIETEPVKVTHRNSGPRYEVASPDDNEVERTKIAAESQQAPAGAADFPRLFGAGGAGMPPAPPQENGGDSGEPTHIGHVAIRRIYLFPVMSRGPAEWSGSAEGGEREQQRPPNAMQGGEQEGGEQPMPSMFAKPFWPFLTPARPSPASVHNHEHNHEHRPHHHHHHLFGADEASRTPGAPDQDRAASGEREVPMAPGQQQQEPQRPLFDPIQMMLDMMHQAISAQMAPAQSDLSGGAGKPDEQPSSGNDNAPAESTSSDERPKMPGGTELMPRPAGAKNETREEIVEIEGKKYLRKTIVNRHIGENIIFMTKRLIFVPLNETADSPAAAPTTESPSTTTTTSLPSTTPAAPEPAGVTMTAEDSSVIPDRVGENKPTTTTSSTTTTDRSASPEEAAASTASSKGPEPLSTVTSGDAEQPATATTGTPATEPTTESATTTTTPKSTESLVERVSGAIEKAAERLVEEAKVVVESTTSTTQAPVASDKPQ